MNIKEQLKKINNNYQKEFARSRRTLELNFIYLPRSYFVFDKNIQYS